MPSRLLKIKTSIPFHLENRLVNKWGFMVDKRIPGEYILFKKNYISDKTANDDGLKRTIRAAVGKVTTSTVGTKIVYLEVGNRHPGLSPYQKKVLEKRCDNIVCFFPDPFSVPESVRARLRIIMQHLTAPEAQFVLEYMDENFPVEDKGN